MYSELRQTPTRADQTMTTFARREHVSSTIHTFIFIGAHYEGVIDVLDDMTGKNASPPQPEERAFWAASK